MISKYFIVILFFLLPLTQIFSQDNSPIDNELSDCMNKNPSTQGMIKCIDNAYKQWDDELNNYYKKLTVILDDEGKANLKDAQRKWIEFRDLEFKNLEYIYSKKDGTMYQPMQASDRMEFIKKRALELKSYYELLTEY